MAETKGNTAIPQGGDHDRVAMLSLKADGTPDQHNPEFIGNREFAVEATKEQFRQQAVSAVDVQERGVAADNGAESVEQDPTIKALQEKHEAAEKQAESAAESAVAELFPDDKESATGTAAVPATSVSDKGTAKK